MKPALKQVATVTRIVDGKTITGPAHWLSPDRVKAPVSMREWMDRK